VAQSTSGTSIPTNWAASTHVLSVLVQVYWDGSNATDETQHVDSLSIKRSVMDNSTGLPFVGATRYCTATLNMDNIDNRFSPDNGSSPLHSYIQYGFRGIETRISIGYVDSVSGAERLRQFTGRLWSGQEYEQAGEKSIVFNLRGEEDAILQYKHTTGLYTDDRADEFISTLLIASGVAGADLDASFCTIHWQWLDEENIWDECQKIAASDAGVFYFDELGQPIFRRTTSLLERSDSTTSQVTLSEGTAWYYGMDQSPDTAYTGVVVEYTPKDAGPAEVLYSEAEPLEIVPSGTRTITARYRYPAQAIITPVSGTDYDAISSGGADMSASLSISVTTYCQRASIEFTNADANQSIYVYGFQVRGYPLLGQEAHEVKESADSTTLTNYWRGADADAKVYPIRGNPYIQSETQATRLASVFRDWLKVPRRLIVWKGPGIPWIQLLDRATVQNADAGIDEDGYVISKADDFSAGSWEQTLVILPVTDLFAYSNYFIIGTSTYADSSTDRAFY